MKNSANKRATARSLTGIAKLGGCVLVSSSLVSAPFSADALSDSQSAESLESRVEKAKHALSSYRAETSEPSETQILPHQKPWDNFYNA